MTLRGWTLGSCQATLSQYYPQSQEVANMPERVVVCIGTKKVCFPVAEAPKARRSLRSARSSSVQEWPFTRQ